MKYIFNPNVTIVDYINNKKVFQFDENGEFETEDKNIIEFMAKYKPFVKCENTQVEKEKKIEPVQKTYKYNCKHCSFGTENKGELLAHYRTHKKE